MLNAKDREDYSDWMIRLLPFIFRCPQNYCHQAPLTAHPMQNGT